MSIQILSLQPVSSHMTLGMLLILLGLSLLIYRTGLMILTFFGGGTENKMKQKSSHAFFLHKEQRLGKEQFSTFL